MKLYIKPQGVFHAFEIVDIVTSSFDDAMIDIFEEREIPLIKTTN